MRRALLWLQRIEDGILVGMLLAMILLAAAQIGLRNFMDGGITWGDPLLRMLVLWTALFGAMVASRNDGHIRIDALTRYLSEGAKARVDRLIRVVSAGLCFFMSYHSARFVIDEFAFGLATVGDIPAWACASIIPFAFLVIGTRYALLAIWPPPDEPAEPVAAVGEGEAR